MDLNIIDKTSTLDRNRLTTHIPRYIVLHSTYSYYEFEDLLNFHKYKRGWNGMGYHIFISETGLISQGRPYGTEGAHTLGFNQNSIGVCFHSYDGYLPDYKINHVVKFLKNLKEQYPETEIISHTVAQLRHILKLLKDKGMTPHLPRTGTITKPKEFRKIKRKLHKLLKNPDVKTDEYLCDRIKRFKNCPGETFSKIASKI